MLMHPALCLPIAAALLWVVFSDLLYRKIPNWLVLALLCVWLLQPLYILASGTTGAVGHLSLATYYWQPLPAALAVLCIGYGLFAIGRVGAGDVKLMAILTLLAGDQQLVFLIITSLAGGVLALTLPVLSLVEQTLAHVVMRMSTFIPGYTPATPVILQAQSEYPKGIPYGIAIAIGAACIMGR